MVWRKKWLSVNQMCTYLSILFFDAKPRTGLGKPARIPVPVPLILAKPSQSQPKQASDGPGPRDSPFTVANAVRACASHRAK